MNLDFPLFLFYENLRLVDYFSFDYGHIGGVADAVEGISIPDNEVAVLAHFKTSDSVGNAHCGGGVYRYRVPSRLLFKSCVNRKSRAH